MLVGLLVALATALVFVEGKKGGQSLSHHEVTRLLNSGDGVLLDVREKGDFKAGHVVDAIHIPYGKLSDRISELDKFKNKTIVVADKMGQQAGAAGKTLKDNGFSTSRLQGGMTEWVSQNLPVVKG